jgi:hypothetical protein
MPLGKIGAGEGCFGGPTLSWGDHYHRPPARPWGVGGVACPRGLVPIETSAIGSRTPSQPNAPRDQRAQVIIISEHIA